MECVFRTASNAALWFSPIRKGGNYKKIMVYAWTYVDSFLVFINELAVAIKYLCLYFVNKMIDVVFSTILHGFVLTFLFLRTPTQLAATKFFPLFFKFSGLISKKLKQVAIIQTTQSKENARKMFASTQEQSFRCSCFRLLELFSGFRFSPRHRSIYTTECFELF